MHAVKFSYINPEVHQKAKNLYTSYILTSPAQPVTFHYNNRPDESSNQAACIKNIHVIPEKHKPEVENLVLSGPGLSVAPKNNSNCYAEVMLITPFFSFSTKGL